MFRLSFQNTYCQFALIIVFITTMTACNLPKQNSNQLSQQIKNLSQQVKNLEAQAETRNQAQAHTPPPQNFQPQTTQPTTPQLTPQQYQQALQNHYKQKQQTTQANKPLTNNPQQLEEEPTVAISVDLKNRLAGVTRQEILEELIRRNREQSNPAMQKAMVAASLSLLDQNQEMDWSATNKLSPNQKQNVERYHAMLLSLYSQASEKKYKFDRTEIEAQLNELFETQPLTIVITEFVYSVRSFGDYTPMESNRFLAGQDNLIGLYCELQNYKINETPDSQFVTNLTQEVALYDSTGTQVWRLDPKKIKDVCRKRRRDFFTAMRMTLPARLNLGEYRLKVRISDDNNDAVAETSIPIQIVSNIQPNS
ncbi:hypothetical protein JD969_19990 [Planctomycetota bacterium]|nr:hypothetical protein JD969_19990 [Planctomycetota bacterium]